MQKTLLITLVLTIIAFSSQAQLVADAGETIHICSNDSIPQLLGSSQTASGGVAPYTFEWSITPFQRFNSTYYASDILSDTSSPNPEVNIGYYMEQIPFFLKVTDANGQMEFDTVLVTFSSFTHITAESQYFMTIGDTIFLTQFEMDTTSTEYKSIYITPSVGLSNDSCQAPLYASPNSTTTYSLHFNNKYGCLFHWERCFTINVFPLGVSTINKDAINPYPNPTTGMVTISYPKTNVQSISIYQTNGNQIHPPINYPNIDLSQFVNGLYIIELVTPSGIEQYKILKRN